ncbi:MAG: WecB/TagA/CpsF family glycosyltransferase [Syntrophomonas sp.]|uniref:WecB/TagA/CpsF family glycosyltransferase n=1 Tax=Syntrophomonas sp. TaxID=2053627 RepID=UPI002609888B|nr:WecB/TagA/CpsF family glycosyltransferase [Syntrophomonas sp.]MDD2509552.1 WecB/TagA/CpsF family glycosyltransferase [Syntrophomonas sp.]MDD3878423.1 WecB/TagA/CpsF family glycosyltransferase [Syntrophomonas sp.]MDD4625478.1 WecB/TagA/CpsF family glycosyltransferase [Syntrophomonas sp.]
MIDKTKSRIDILGCQIDQVNMEEALAFIEKSIEESIPSHIITVNAEIVYQAQKDKQLQEVINAASLNTPDGIGIVWAARQLGFLLEERVTGIDLLDRLCSKAVAKGWRIFFLGAAPGIAEQAARKLLDKYPGLLIAGTGDGYFKEEEEKAVIAEIKALSPQILFLGLGAPKQEYFIRRNLKYLDKAVCIGVGGSFDVVAGIKKRAPKLFINLNLEWLYRLLVEPTRFKRQLALPRFAWLVLKQKWRGY